MSIKYLYGKLCVHWLLIIGLLIPMLFASTNLYAQNPPPEIPNPLPEDPSEPEQPVNEDTYAVTYARDFGITEAEARRRLNIMLQMPKLVREIATNEAEYAAAWINHEPELALVVSFSTTDGADRLKKYLDSLEWAAIVRAEQSAISHEELRTIQETFLNAAKERPELQFESGVFFPAGKIHIFTPTVSEVEQFLQSIPAIQDRLEFFAVIFQENLSVDAAAYSPEMRGGTHLTGDTLCTAGFVVKRTSTGKRFISTAGHCGDNLTSESTNLGAVVHQHNYYYDLQVHDVFRARGSGLTNSVILNQSQVKTVVSLEYTGSLYGDYVCKYGRTTGITCGTITSTTHSWNGAGPNVFLKIAPSNPITNLTCSGDSGGPVYKELSGGELVAVGLVKGAPSASSCPVVQAYFVATPLDYVNSMGGYTVLDGPYSPHFYQNVFAEDGTCTQYTADINPTGSFSNWQSSACQTYAPGSGTVTSYTNWVAGDKLHEALWRGGYGYIRDIPINNDGTVNWGSAPGWQQCCSGMSVGGQGAYIAGNSFHQNVFETDGTCNAYSATLDNNGNFTPWDWAGTCSTYAPGTGNVTSYTNWVFGNILYEALWRGGYGYMRNVPINDDGTVNWGSAPGWGSPCCSGLSVGGQGAYVLWHE